MHTVFRAAAVLTRPMRLTPALAAILLCAFTACAPDDVLEPGATETSLVQGQVEVSLRVAPEILEPPGTVVATLTYENLGSESVVLSSAYGCLSFASVYHGEHRIPFPATQYGCTAAISHRDLEPGSPIRVEWALDIGGSEGMHVGPGTYRFVADLNTHDHDLERKFEIR